MAPKKKGDIKKIHFMGIGGSGISAAAMLAKKIGYRVTGCNLDKETDYLKMLGNARIKISIGHAIEHLENSDLLVVSPAVLYSNKEHPELSEGRRRGILVTWEEFVGHYLQKDKELIAIAGTHGKSTTTALVGVVFEDAMFDPSVVLGAKALKWRANYRFGAGKIFVIEADEFNDNFLHYSPSAIILNNIEFDHPDYFSSDKDVVESFAKFVGRLTDKKILIINQDSPGIAKLISSLPKKILRNIKLHGYTFSDTPAINLERSVKVKILKKDKGGADFLLKSESLNMNEKYRINLPGDYNVANASGAILLGGIYGIPDSIIRSSLTKFGGTARRLELLGEKNGIKVYDDYAHHPTAIRATLSALRQIHPKSRIWVIAEPHSYSRTKALLDNYKDAFMDADRVIIAPVFKARDKDTFGVSGQSIVGKTNHKDAVHIDNFDDIVTHLQNKAKTGDVIIVMGAGKSYLLARQILEAFK